MREFNLNEAKAGKPVCTRDGHDARIICFDRKSVDYPIIALISMAHGECVETFPESGLYHIGADTEFDLFMKPETKTGWVNIYKGYLSDEHRFYDLYPSKKEAEDNKIEGWVYIDTVQISWEE